MTRKTRLVCQQEEAAISARALTTLVPVAVYYKASHSFCAVDATQSYVGFADTEGELVDDLLRAGWSVICLDDYEKKSGLK